MPKLSTPIQGLIVVILAVIVGVGTLAITGNNEDEGFLGTTKSIEITPIETEEPSDNTGAEGSQDDAEDELSPEATEEPDDVSATEEPTDADATEEPSDGDDSADTSGDDDQDDQASADDTTDDEDDDEDDPLASITQEFKSPLGADGNLLFQVFMALGLLFGASFAVRKDFTSHRNIMTFLIIVNWFSIFGRMTDTFGNVSDLDVNQNLVYFHAGLGGITMIFASYLAIRMWFEDQLPDALKIDPIKFWMRLTLTSWLGLIILGILIYLGLYS